MSVSPRLLHAVRALRILLVAGLAVHLALLLVGRATGGGVDPAANGWLANAVMAAAAALCLARPALVREERGAWLAVGAALSLWTAGNVYWQAVLVDLDAAPYPSLADGLYLAMPPLVYVALVLLVRRRVARFQASLWLDGLVGGLGVATFGAALVLGAVTVDATASLAAVVTNLAYPLADLLLLAMVAGVFALMGWRPGRAWWFLGAGIVAFAAADSAYVVRIAAETYTQGLLLDAGWPVGIVLMAFAAWQEPPARRPARLEGWVVLVVPVLSTVGALSVLVAAHFRSVPTPAVLLAGATLLAAMARTGLTFREVSTLADTRREALTDELTGLPNRRALLRCLDAALATRVEGQSVALLLIDLDRFKEVNDSLGHHVGDQLLRRVGARLAAALRVGDVLARLGGDEFAVLLGSGTSAAHAEAAAHRLHGALAEPFPLDDVALHVDGSIGVAVCPDHAGEATALLQRADVAMYQAKRSGTGHCLYDAARDANTRDRLQAVEELRTAVETGQLVLHYQPKCDLVTGDVTGVEALVRWAHPVRGLVYPDVFLPLVERIGLMRALTLEVLGMALRQCRSWRDAGIHLSVAVNLSVSTLVDARLPGDVARLLGEAGLPPDALELEITENMLMADPVRGQEILARLRALGVGIAIDDFGTGYSSLAYLRQLTVDELKLDRSFVTDMATDPALAAIVRASVDLAHSLGLRVVAEGVETRAAWDRLAGFGCDQAQGYHLSRPLPADRLTTWLEERRGPLAALADVEALWP